MESSYNQQNTEEMEINLLELLGVLWSKAAVILLSGLTLALLAFLGSQLLITPQYESTTKMYVLAQQSSDAITSADMQTSTYLTRDYMELINSRQVTETVIAQLGLDMKHEDLIKKMTVSTSTDTRVMSIIVTDEDPYEAARIADAIRDISAEHIKNVMNVESVNTVDKANIPEEPSSPNSTRNAILGGAIGVILAMAIVLISYIMNDSIKTTEDIEKYLGLSILGSIPLDEGEQKSTKQKRKRAAKR